jgi:transcriptional regulator
MSSVFNRCTHADVQELLDTYPLAILVSNGPDGISSTPLPMMYEVDDQGALARLVGHMSLANEQLKHLHSDPRACFLFQGPQAYISPRLVPGRNWAPTWNYALVRVHTVVEFSPERNDEVLRRLVAKMESGHSDAWTVEELGERYEKLSRYITAFTAEVITVQASFKLGQDEKEAAFTGITAGLDQPELVRWMRKFAGTGAER